MTPTRAASTSGRARRKECARITVETAWYVHWSDGGSFALSKFASPQPSGPESRCDRRPIARSRGGTPPQVSIATAA